MTQTTYVARALVLNSQDEVLLLVRSATDPTRPGDFDFPGGGVDEVESPHDGAAREILEETGIVIQPNELTLAYADTRLNRGKSTLRLLFVARTGAADVKLSDEHSAYEWVRLADVPTRFPHPVWSKAIAYLLENKVL